MIKTKIITTIGPATETKDMLLKLKNNGATIARLNFSHGTYEWYKKLIKEIHEINKTAENPFTMMLDTKGPEIRVSGKFEKLEIKKGMKYTLGYEKNKTKVDIPVDYEKIVNELDKNDLIQLDGGLIQLEVIKKSKDHIETKALNNGTLTAKRHVNLPGVKLSLPILSKKDKEDLEFCMKNGVNMIAASFVNEAKDIDVIRKEVKKYTNKFIPIIAKIETKSGLENIDTILEKVDGIMIARGDLSVELSYTKIPLAQKELIEKAQKANKPVIMATQMLSSMVENIFPTRAEISDIGNALISQVDAIMLSEETSVGKYPEKCVEVMHKIADEVEQSTVSLLPKCKNCSLDQELEMLKEGLQFAECVKAKAIILATNNVNLVRNLSSLRPQINVIIFTNSHELIHYCNVLYNSRAFFDDKLPKVYDEEYITKKIQFLKTIKLIDKSQKVIIFGDLFDKDDLFDTVMLRKVK